MKLLSNLDDDLCLSVFLSVCLCVSLVETLNADRSSIGLAFCCFTKLASPYLRDRNAHVGYGFLEFAVAR
jgi:hypothetical protein